VNVKRKSEQTDLQSSTGGSHGENLELHCIDFDDEENKQELPFLFSPSLKYAFKITISFFILHKKSLESPA
jgi:hypothetical protein